MALQRTPQAVNCSTFKPPPPDHGLTTPALYRYHAQNSPDHPVFTYSDLDTGVSTTITFRKAWKFICAATNMFSKGFQPAASRYADQHRDKTQRPVIAILALTDTLTYMFSIISIMSIGCAAFPLSPRNSAAANARLIHRTGALQLLVSADPQTKGMAEEVVTLLWKEGFNLELLPIPLYRELEDGANAQHQDEGEVAEAEDGDVMLILHSSGTTAFPKPINFTKRGISNLMDQPYYGDVDLAGKRMAAHTNPPFHSLNLATYIFPLSCGVVFALYPPKPIIPTPANYMEAWVTDKCNFVLCVAVFLEVWAREPSNIPKLKALDAILFSGATVTRSLGRALATAGITIHTVYATTEIGSFTKFIPGSPPPPEDWEYFTAARHIKYAMQPQHGLDGVYEPIIIPTNECIPRIFNTTHEGAPAYAVGDLLEQHPSDPTLWRVFGRKDDQIVLITSENVNPVPLEAIVIQDDHVHAALLFGRNRIRTGLLVQPAQGLSVPPDDLQALATFRDLIWPSVERANASAPRYAYIQKEMIIVTSPTKPLEYTVKGTPRRLPTYGLYSDEIDAMYPDEDLTHHELPDRA